MPSTVMTKGGRITMPASLRKQMGVRPGDRFEVFLEGNTIHLVRVPDDPLGALRGVVKGEGLYDALIQERAEEMLRDEIMYARIASRQET